MTRSAAKPVSVLAPHDERLAATTRPRPTSPLPRWRQRYSNDRYSRRVAVLKRLLPMVGLMLLVLVAVWPRLGPLLESVRLSLPIIDLRDARELRMLNPRYAGVDRFNRPFVVTAAIGRQVPNRDDLMSLERPRAEMIMRRGASVVVTAATAVYQSQAQLLDLFDDVNLIHENGTRFVTKTAHVDVAHDTAEGHDPVTGRGPSGDIDAEGFRILDKGDTVVFTGKSDLLLKGSKPSAQPAADPPGLPPEIAETAARIEAAATESTVGLPEPAAPSREGSDAALAASPERSGASADNSRRVGMPDRKSPAGAHKAKPDDG